MSKVVGDIEKKTLVEETEIKWQIPYFLSLRDIADKYKSSNFSFASNSWHILIDRPRPTNSQFWRLHLCNDKIQEFPVEYNFGLEKQDGSVEMLQKGILKGNQKWYLDDPTGFISEMEVYQRHRELLPSGILTLRGRLKSETAPSFQPSPVLDKPKLENLINLELLSENLKNFFAKKDTCDVTLQVKCKEFKAHKSMLMARSSVFYAMFQNDTLEKQTGIVNISDCDPECFQVFLDYIYSGKLEGFSYHSAFQLYITSRKYDVQKMKEYCVEYLMENLTTDNACEIVKLADKHDERNLLAAAQVFFNENWNKIFGTSEWENFMKKDYRLANSLLIELSKAKESH